MSLIARHRDGDQGQDCPFWILRHHSPSPITALRFVSSGVKVYTDAQDEEEEDDDDDSETETDADAASSGAGRFLLAGDSQGRVSLTDLSTYRAILQWQAHKDGSSVLGVEIWDDQIVTHGRDNTFKVWRLPPLNQHKASFASRQAGDSTPCAEPTQSLLHEVNALNFCRFSLLDGENKEASLAVPHTMESGWVDIYHLPSRQRLHTAVGKPASTMSSTGSNPTSGLQRAAILMSVHLLRLPSVLDAQENLALLAGYEDGTIQLWTESSGEFKLKWKRKIHLESVLSTSIHITANEIRLISTGADMKIGFLTLNNSRTDQNSDLIRLNNDREVYMHVNILKTDKPGRACSAFLTNTKAIVGGWDGKSRIYQQDQNEWVCSRVLRYHKESIQTVDASQNLIALGSKDGRISLWRV
ncbi:unnamed protein product [Sympodiomycopsis kandeliae]